MAGILSQFYLIFEMTANVPALTEVTHQSKLSFLCQDKIFFVKTERSVT